MNSDSLSDSVPLKNDWMVKEQRMKSAILRVIADCQKDVSSLLENSESAVNANRFLSALEEFSVVVKRRLLFSARLEYLYASQVKAVQMKTKTGNVISCLEAKLREAKVNYTENVKAREEMLDKINEKIKSFEDEAYEDVATIRSQAEENLKLLVRQSEIVKDKLESELLEKRKHNYQLEREHQQIEVELREKRKSIEDETKIIIDHYDQTMEDFWMEKQDLSQQLRQKMDVLAIKQEEFSVLEERFKEIEEEKLEEERQRMAAIQADFHKEHSARIIQKAWHHFKMKKMLKKVQKKGRRKKSTVKEAKRK